MGIYGEEKNLIIYISLSDKTKKQRTIKYTKNQIGIPTSAKELTRYIIRRYKGISKVKKRREK